MSEWAFQQMPGSQVNLAKSTCALCEPALNIERVENLNTVVFQPSHNWRNVLRLFT